MTLTNTELWGAFKKSNRKSFGDLFRRYYSTMFQYGSKFCRHINLLKECIRELLLEALLYRVYKNYCSREKMVAEEVTDEPCFVQPNYQDVRNPFLATISVNSPKTNKHARYTRKNSMPDLQRFKRGI